MNPYRNGSVVVFNNKHSTSIHDEFLSFGMIASYDNGVYYLFTATTVPTSEIQFLDIPQGNILRDAKMVDKLDPDFMAMVVRLQESYNDYLTIEKFNHV